MSKKSTPECRKDCDVYEEWQQFEADNADLIMQLHALRWRKVSEELPEKRTGLWAVENAVGTISLTRKFDRKIWLFAFTKWMPLPEGTQG